jgi:hypothetical protein
MILGAIVWLIVWLGCTLTVLYTREGNPYGKWAGRIGSYVSTVEWLIIFVLVGALV